MRTSSFPSNGPAESPRLPLAPFLLLSLLIALAACFVFDRGSAHASLFHLTNLVGPTAESLLQHQGLTACTTAMGTPGNPICFHAGRMPIPTLVVASGVTLFGDHYLPVAFFKVFLFVLPIESAIALVWLRLPCSRRRQLLIAALLLVPFAMTPFLADVVNLQVEEGYSYSFLGLALAILLFALPSGLSAPKGTAPNRVPAATPLPPIVLALLFSLSVTVIYLAKSSMAPATFVLTLAYLVRERRTALRLLVLLLVASAPIGWALHQHHASGRYAIGTSIDGINLHKGNSAIFARFYPPPPGNSLDRFDPLLNVGHSFPDEWSFNDYHQHAALAYLRAHPGRTVRGDLRKLYVLFVTIHKLGSTESHGLLLKFETLSLILLRLLLWSALGLSGYALLRRRAWSADGLIYLLLVAACVFPYLLGFAYVRHISILIYPSVLLLCAVLCTRTVPDSSAETASLAA